MASNPAFSAVLGSPPRPATSASILKAVTSTPSNRGSGAAAEHLHKHEVKHWAPWMQRDVEFHETRPIDDFLTGLLTVALPKDMQESPPKHLLRTCLKAVLPICNGIPVQGRDNKRTRLSILWKGTSIRDLLTQYCRVTTELASYESFVSAVNLALDELKDVKGPLNSYDKDGTEIFLQCNSQRTLCGYRSSVRGPDATFIEAQIGVLLNDTEGGSWYDVVRGAHCSPGLQARLRWENALGSAELKRRGGRIATEPPLGYKVSLADPGIPPQSYAKEIDLYKKETENAVDAPPPPPVMSEPAFKAPHPVAGGSGGASVDSSLLRRSSRIASIPSFKRTREDDDETAVGPQSLSKKPRLESSKTPPTAPKSAWGPPMVQAAAYVAERLYAVAGLSHVINLVILNEFVWVWWYDRRGAIQSGGLNFVQDLPRFLVLLLALQRFTPAEWGKTSAVASTALRLDNDVTISFDDQKKPLLRRFGLAGRGTCVLPTASTSPHPRAAHKTLADRKLIAKFCWPEALRTSEAKILLVVATIASGCPEVKGHVPDLIAHCDFPTIDTGRIRRMFGLADPMDGVRNMRVLVFRELQPITQLSGERFWGAFLECFKCHYHLWQGGVHHRDISVSNLMYYTTREGTPVGVLNDFDLSTLPEERKGPSGNQRTGTLPFLALDLLTQDAIAGKVEHRYRHDAESFMWVLAWVSVRFLESVEYSNEVLDKWLSDDFADCALRKSGFLNRPQVKASPSHTFNFDRHRRVAMLEALREVAINHAEMSGGKYDEPKDEEVYQAYLNAFAFVVAK